MRNRRLLRLALICLGVMGAVVLGTSLGLALRTLVSGGRVIQPPIPIVDNCRNDPARLPTPTGPDGKPANFLHTCGGRIYDSRGHEVRIFGVNWSGMEGSGYAPGGLNNRNYQEILDQVAALGYNTIRVPFSNEAIDANRPISNVNFDLNPDLQGLTGLEMLDRLVAAARERGLKVILDRHQTTSSGPITLWYDTQVSEDRWVADWRMLAARYRGNDTVIGADLSNEPHGPATWGYGDPATDWHRAAERAGNAVLAANPNLLVFVEGIETYQNDRYWWGGNLEGARQAPIRLNVPNRLVYSPHDYGPSISGESWFWDPRFPANLPGVWDQYWGYLQEEGIAPVVVGEFGGWSFGTDPDGQWQRALLAYLVAHKFSAVVWSLNPSWDTGGILEGNWLTVDPIKEAAYRALMAPPIAVGPSGVFGKARTQARVFFRQDAGSQPGGVNFAFRVFDDGPQSIDLSRVEIRYWLKGGPASPRAASLQIESGGLPGATVNADFVPAKAGGEDGYLRIRFAPGSGSVTHYRESGRVVVHFVKPAANPPTGDYSYQSAQLPPDTYQEWDQVTLYLDGRLAWGKEPS
ncbi:MAG TPA: glycoside hydrolase family 5 protein [Chloroflexota bacterium]|nr:glycoside hydrolase family 5 protein [Chloroflexota bacterium]